MPESLAITYDELREELGRFLGMRTVSAWSETQADDVDAIIKSGLRKTYWPMVAGKEGMEAYQWSFLKRRATITLVADVYVYDLADDFGGLVSAPTFPDGSGNRILQLVDEESLVTLHSKVSLSGTPNYCAVRAKTPVVNGDTQYEIVLYPKPSSANTLSYRYTIEPPMLTETNQAALGGPQISLALLEACLDEAEKTLGDTEGLHYKKFQEALASCIAYDRGP